MKYKIFLFARILLIIVVAQLFIQLIGSRYFYTQIGLVILISLLIYELIRFMNRFKEMFESFLSALRDNDTSQKLVTRSFFSVHKEMVPLLTELNQIIQDKKIQIEKQQLLFQVLVENIDTGILMYDGNGKVSVWNKAASQLFNLTYLSNVSQLKFHHEELYNSVISIQPDENKLISFSSDLNKLQLSMKLQLIRSEKEEYRILSFQNISEELGDAELKSYQKLIRVLTHEIMNSISPLVTVSNTMSGFYKQNGIAKKQDELEDWVIEETIDGLHMIEERGKGLMNFVQKYRQLNLNKQLQIEEFPVEELFVSMRIFFKDMLEAYSCQFESMSSNENLCLKADKGMLEQVIINLIKNAIEAIGSNQKDGKVLLKASSENGRIILEVIDNGPGISEELQSEIFIPFFTTREEGSGIGLSLSREIIRLHKGNLRLRSTEGHTVFRISLLV